MPNTKINSSFADSIAELIENLKKSWIGGNQELSKQDFKSELEQTFEDVFNETIETTLNLQRDHPEHSKEEIAALIKHPNRKRRILGEEQRPDVHISHKFSFQYSGLKGKFEKLTDSIKTRVWHDWKDKFRFIVARFLSTVAIGTGALMIAMFGYHYLGFETAVLKKIEYKPAITQTVSTKP
ncbi:hypothetical protein RI844_04910 [Thalassotalea fonticola]|uniref:Uncharacterized protein n=1 Tax=Thalassotalea fonticola TaxID=3065649 RepID=A0ABZ0GSD0_9GAMM|nr:hypothetical protein RI844_04910 [Colwelliaceae bacterium S1-1]